ncbi:tRNA (adenosine(37)-N6)-threonylcarbamoyltransferase complex ATPase subunit type 1 TsaE [bacterium]|nr:tRNA (adenosine(37)-N6)-threonylcarbamoyltransferase complex ATPase subunit type 1 TsaE [bacterium]
MKKGKNKYQNKEKVKKYITRSEKESFQLAKHLSSKFKGNEVVLLQGELGAGKTVFTKGIASGLGMKDTHQVCSPSYTLVNIYQADFPIYHIDLYRLGNREEIEDLGWEDYLGQGVIVVEWAEKINFNLDHPIRVFIQIGGEEKRKIRIHY